MGFFRRCIIIGHTVSFTTGAISAASFLSVLVLWGIIGINSLLFIVSNPKFSCQFVSQAGGGPEGGGCLVFSYQ